MPAYYTVDAELQVVFVIHLGFVDDDEALAQNEKLQRDPLITPGLSYFVDLREARSEFRSTAMLKRLAERSKQWRADPSSGSRVAILVAKDISYGLARMFEGYSNADDNDFRIFLELQEAADWLGLPISTIEKVRAGIGQN